MILITCAGSPQAPWFPETRVGSTFVTVGLNGDQYSTEVPRRFSEGDSVGGAKEYWFTPEFFASSATPNSPIEGSAAVVVVGAGESSRLRPASLMLRQPFAPPASCSSCLLLLQPLLLQPLLLQPLLLQPLLLQPLLLQPTNNPLSKTHRHNLLKTARSCATAGFAEIGDFPATSCRFHTVETLWFGSCQVRPRLTAATTPMDNPCCSCKLTAYSCNNPDWITCAAAVS